MMTKQARQGKQVYTVQEFHHGSWHIVFWYTTEAIATQHMNRIRRDDGRAMIVLMNEREAKQLYSVTQQNSCPACGRVDWNCGCLYK